MVVAKDIVCSVLTVRVKSWKMDTKFHCTVCHVAQIRQKYTDDQFGFKESSLLDQNAPINQNTRVCNLHFEGNLCKDSVPIHMNLSSPKPETPVRRPLIRHEIHDENNITEPNSKYESKIEKQSEWFREFENSSTDTNNNIQFQNIYVDASTQDYIQNCDVQTQTTTKYETAEIGIQTSFSKMKPEDIQEDDETTRLYTGSIVHRVSQLCYIYVIVLHLYDPWS